jgi:hypothetical protein
LSQARLLMSLAPDSPKPRQAVQFLAAQQADRMLPAALLIALPLSAVLLIAAGLFAAALFAALPNAVRRSAMGLFAVWRLAVWGFAQRLRSAVPARKPRVKRVPPRGCGRMAAEPNFPRQGPALVCPGPGG